MEYFGYEEDALKGIRDINYLTTFSRNIIVRITPQGERIEDEVFVNFTERASADSSAGR